MSKRQNVDENELDEFDGYLRDKAKPFQSMVFTLWIDINPHILPSRCGLNIKITFLDFGGNYSRRR